MLALKTEFPLKFFTVLNIFFTIQDFWATLCLPWKIGLPWNFSLYWIYFLHSGILSNLHALPLKNRGCPEFSVLIIYFYHLGFLSNLRFPWKTGLPWNFSLYWNIFIIQDFWATCACPEKQSCPEMFRCMEYTFYIQNSWANCMRLPWKTELPWYFSLYLNMYFYHSRCLSN